MMNKLINFIREKIFRNNEPQSVNQNSASFYLRYGVYLTVIFVLVLIYWGWLAPLDEGIPAQGNVVLESSRKTVQHPQGGIIEDILITEGQLVEEGQLLIRLVSTTSNATLIQFKSQSGYLKHQIEAYRELVEEGYYPRNQYIDLQRQLVESNAKLLAAEEEVKRTEIRAISSGKVMGLQFKTKSGVIQPGVKILEIVPEKENLVIEAKIPIHLIDRVTAGLSADIHFTALNQRKTPILSGVVVWVSADKFEENNRPDISYYTARIKITEETMIKLGGQEILPGMPADVIIKFGERSFINYLLKPITDKLQTSFIEK